MPPVTRLSSAVVSTRSGSILSGAPTLDAEGRGPMGSNDVQAASVKAATATGIAVLEIYLILNMLSLPFRVDCWRHIWEPYAALTFSIRRQHTRRKAFLLTIIVKSVTNEQKSELIGQFQEPERRAIRFMPVHRTAAYALDLDHRQHIIAATR